MLLDPPRPFVIDETSELTYCAYHSSSGHAIEDCTKLRNILEQFIQEGLIDA